MVLHKVRGVELIVAGVLLVLIQAEGMLRLDDIEKEFGFDVRSFYLYHYIKFRQCRAL